MDTEKMKNWISLLVTFAPGLFAAVFYGFTSGSMSFINKVLLYFFNIISLVSDLTQSQRSSAKPELINAVRENLPDGPKRNCLKICYRENT